MAGNNTEKGIKCQRIGDGKLLAWYMKEIFELSLIISLIGKLQKGEYNFRLHQRNTISKTWEVIIPFYATLGRSYFKYSGLRYILKEDFIQIGTGAKNSQGDWK